MLLSTLAIYVLSCREGEGGKQCLRSAPPGTPRGIAASGGRGAA